MSEECTHDCSTCKANCDSKNKIQFAKLNQYSKVGKVIAVVSGKGGVGKSTVSSLIATSLSQKGYKVGILDADITGPSIPKAFGLNDLCEAAPLGGILPKETANKIKVISLNLLLEDATSPVVWRGPVIAGTVQQFWTDVVWGDIDYMVIDCPPGTGDVPLTVFQSIPVDGLVIVSSPQDLVSLIVEKAVKMAKLMNIPIVGIVENMSYFECPDCKKKYNIFGESHVDEIAGKYNIPVLAKLPIDSKTASLCDAGKIEEADTSTIENVSNAVISAPKRVINNG